MFIPSVRGRSRMDGLIAYRDCNCSMELQPDYPVSGSSRKHAFPRGRHAERIGAGAKECYNGPCENEARGASAGCRALRAEGLMRGGSP